MVSIPLTNMVIVLFSLFLNGNLLNLTNMVIVCLAFVDMIITTLSFSKYRLYFMLYCYFFIFVSWYYPLYECMVSLVNNIWLEVTSSASEGEGGVKGFKISGA